jgi:hypothetical protein
MRRRTVSLTDKVVEMVDRLARRNVTGNPGASQTVNGAARDGGVAARVLERRTAPDRQRRRLTTREKSRSTEVGKEASS